MLGMKLFRQTDAEIFETEAVPHLPVLKRLALHLARNQDDAEDLLQETFAQALKSFDRYQPGTNCCAWLCKIMFHKRSQQLRARRRYAGNFDEAAEYLAAPTLNVLPSNFMSEKLSLALSDLPLKNRQIVWLSEVEEFTYREIAEQLEIPMGTVMSRLHRGRQMLRESFSRRSAPPVYQN